MTRPRGPLDRDRVKTLASQARATPRPPKRVAPQTVAEIAELVREQRTASGLRSCLPTFFKFWDRGKRIEATWHRDGRRPTGYPFAISKPDLDLLRFLLAGCRKAADMPPETPIDDDFWNSLETNTPAR
jgi:hypothetical protein